VLKEPVDFICHFRPSTAEVTVPAYFNDAQRQSTKDRFHPEPNTGFPIWGEGLGGSRATLDGPAKS